MAFAPKLRGSSPPVSRQQSLPLFELTPRHTQEAHLDLDQERHQLQRQKDLTENSRRQREQELKEREQDLEIKARELERDRVRLQTLREETRLNAGEIGYAGENNRESDTQSSLGQFGIRPRERRISLHHQLQRPLSQMELDESTESPFPPISQKSSTSRPLPQRSQHLIPSPTDNNLSTLQQIHTPKPSLPPPLLQNQESLREPHSPNRCYDDASNSNTSSTSTTLSHAACCGCEKCSVSKYRSSESVTSQQPSGRKLQNSSIESKRSSKLGTGWIRRLSMPAGNSFSFDYKKHHNNNSIGDYKPGSGSAGGTSTSKGGGMFSLDSKKNVSTTVLGVREDGKLSRSSVPAHGRRSHEASGVGNRSMTNLDLR